MSKKVLVVSLGGIALASAAYIGTAWYAGKQFESHIDQAIKEITTSTPVVKITDVKMQRGLFSSQHEMTIAINPDCFGGASQSASMQGFNEAKIIVRQSVKHGPLFFGGGVSAGLASYQGTATFDQKIMQQVKKVLGDQAPFSWSGTIQFNGTDKFEMKSPGFEVKEKGTNIVWKGITGSGTGNFKDKSYKLAMLAPKLSITSAEQVAGAPSEVLVENVSLEATGVRGKTGVDLGAGSFTIGSMRFVDAAKKEAFSISQLTYKGAVKENGDYLDFDAAYEVGSFVFGPDQKKYGPAVFSLGLEHLHAPTAISIGKSVNKMMCIKPEQQAALMQENVKLWKDLFATLLTHQPVLSIKQIKLGSPDGEITAKGKLRIEGFKAAMLDDPVAMMSELPKIVKLEFEGQAAEKMLISFMKEGSVTRGKQQLSADGSTPAPEALKAINDSAEQEAKEKLQMVVSQNFAKHEGDKYTFSFSFADGQAKLNGAPYALPFLPPPPEAPAAPAAPAPAAPAATEPTPAPAPAPAAPAPVAPVPAPAPAAK